jgi:DNA-binding SARP family transcriptional activator
MLQEIERLLEECDLIEAGGETQTAIERAQQALQAAQQTNNTDLIAQAHIKLAKLLTSVGRCDEARSLAEDTLSDNQENWIGVEAYIILGNCASETESIRVAEDLYHKAAEQARKVDYRAGLASALHCLAASIHMIRGHFDLALTTMEHAADLRQDSGPPDWGLYFLRAYVYQITGDSQRVRSALDQLLPLVRPATRVAGAYYFLWARQALDDEEYERAKEYLRLALRIANNTGVPNLNIWVRLEQSRYYRLTGDPSAARSWAEDAARYAERVGFKHFYGMALAEAGQAAWDSGDMVSAEEYLLNARQVLTSFGAAYNLARTTFLLAAFYQRDKKPQNIKAWLEACENILKGGFAFILERERALAFPLVAFHLKSRNNNARAAAEGLLQHLSKVSPPALRIYGLGQFVLWQSRRRIPDQAWNRRKAGELCRFLLLKPNHSAGREEILDGLWPDSSPSTGQAQFHQATSTLRHILEPDLPDKFPSRYLSVEGERVYLNLPPGSLVDFERLETILPQSIRSMNIDDLEQALSLYVGELFPMDRYNDWSVSRRKSLEEQYLRGLLALGQAYLDKQQYFKVLECSRRIMQIDAWNEDAVLLGMKAYIHMRDIPRAMRLYKDLESTLQKELDLAPRADLRALVKELRQH